MATKQVAGTFWHNVAESGKVWARLKSGLLSSTLIPDVILKDSHGSVYKQSLSIGRCLWTVSKIEGTLSSSISRNTSAVCLSGILKSDDVLLAALPFRSHTVSSSSLHAEATRKFHPLKCWTGLDNAAATAKSRPFNSLARFELSNPGMPINFPRQDPGSFNKITTARAFGLETFVERWKSATEKFKDSLSVKPRTTGSSGVSFKHSDLQQGSKELLQGVSSSNPIGKVRKTFSQYREAMGLQVEAFWKRNYLVVVGAIGVGVCLLLWRVMFGIAGMFVSLSEGMAKFGFFALAAAFVTLGGVYLRARITINPDSVYRIAMRKLNTSAALLEVMGAPLSGTDLRAYVMSGGGLRFKGFRPILTGKRCFVMFPIRGSERRGLVSVEVKKKNGQYDFKLLAVDVPTAGGDQRLYLVGDENGYRVGGGIISELRDPIVTAMAAQKEFEELDITEQEEDERREADNRAKEKLGVAIEAGNPPAKEKIAA